MEPRLKCRSHINKLISPSELTNFFLALRKYELSQRLLVHLLGFHSGQYVSKAAKSSRLNCFSVLSIQFWLYLTPVSSERPTGPTDCWRDFHHRSDGRPPAGRPSTASCEAPLPLRRPLASPPLALSPARRTCLKPFQISSRCWPIVWKTWKCQRIWQMLGARETFATENSFTFARLQQC